MKIIGHRGSNWEGGENTLIGIEKALNDGVDGVEIDLRAVGSSVIALHDETVDRTTNGSGHYKSFTTNSLRSLKCKNNDHIPLLNEILCLPKPIRELILEFKEPGIENRVLEILRDHSSKLQDPFKKNITVSSFDIGITQQLSLYLDDWKLAILYKDNFFSAVKRAKKYRAAAVHAPIKDITIDNIDFAHRNNRKVYAFTVNSVNDYNRCLASGVDGIFTDRPAIFSALNEGMD